ncbi:hypothetical protein [Haloarcula laminariae]|uniref:hypothetical protein n=1 Tax=Haloarcula laminariae TaxID=2961577 RepID=UPI00240551F7|nr:hypothetical protein [Halomicroarcula sp. FL173]
MRRRRMLGLTGIALTTGAAGCLTNPEGGSGAADERSATPSDTADSGAGTPTETDSGSATDAPSSASAVTEPIYELWGAYNDEDAGRLVDTYHPEAPDAPTESSIPFQGTVTIESTTVLARSEDSATVEVEATISGELNESQTQLFELRRHDGEWKVWSYEEAGDGSSEPATPQAVFEFEFDESAAGASNEGVLRITHSGGDNIDAARLYIRGTGIVETSGATPDVTEQDTDWGSATGTTEVTAGTEITVGVTSDCDIRVVWATESTSQTLASYQGPGN